MIRGLNQREKNILYVTAGVVIFALAFNFFAAPLMNKSSRLDRQIRLARARLIKYTVLLSQKENLQSRYDSYFSEAPTEDGSGGNSVGGLTELERLAEIAGIRIIDLRPRPAVRSETGYEQIPIDLRTEGEIEGYFKFIYDVQNSLSLLKIKSFQLSARPNTSLLEGSFSIYQVHIAD